MIQYDLRLNDDRVPCLVKEQEFAYGSASPAKNPAAIYEIMQNCFDVSNLPEEHIYVICLGAKCEIKGIFEVSHCTSNMCFFSAKDIFTRAIMCGASSIVMVHNHPSGDPTMSQQDVVATQKIVAAGALLDIALSDSIVIGNKCYFSAMENIPEILKNQQ